MRATGAGPSSYELSGEPILEPELPIVDAHHHLWYLTDGELLALERDESIAARALVPTFYRHRRYLFDEFMGDLKCGHNVRASVFVECHAMYRARGPEMMKSIGEVEFANGVAAMAASRTFGDVQACAGIVGNVDLRIGDAAHDVLSAHLQAGGGRYRGVRGAALTAYDDDASILGAGGVPHLLLSGEFRAGFKWLQKLGLSFDAWVLESQLPELIDLARTFPQTQIIVDHVGGPVGVGRYAGNPEERFRLWRQSMQTLSSCINVAIKLGGLGMPMPGLAVFASEPPATSLALAAAWKPYIESCIEAFGTERCMFESNFPVDAAVGSYAVLWNAFKHLAAGASPAEKTALFSGTATRIYRLNL